MSSTAIEFYQATKQYVENFGLSNLDREDRILFRKGKNEMRDLEEQINTIQRTSERNRYQKSELIVIVGYYLKGYNRQEIANTFMNNNPGQKHTGDSIQMVAAQLETLDKTRPDATLLDVKSLVKEVALEIDSSRFDDSL